MDANLIPTRLLWRDRDLREEERRCLDCGRRLIWDKLYFNRSLIFEILTRQDILKKLWRRATIRETRLYCQHSHQRENYFKMEQTSQFAKKKHLTILGHFVYALFSKRKGKERDREGTHSAFQSRPLKTRRGYVTALCSPSYRAAPLRSAPLAQSDDLPLWKGWIWNSNDPNMGQHALWRDSPHAENRAAPRCRVPAEQRLLRSRK